MEAIVGLVVLAALIWGGVTLTRSLSGSSAKSAPNRPANQSPASSAPSGDSIAPDRRNEAHLVLRVEQNGMQYAETNVTKFVTGNFDGMSAGDCTAVRIALHLAKGDQAGAKKILTGSVVSHFLKTGQIGTSLTPENYPNFTHADSVAKYLLPHFDKNN